MNTRKRLLAFLLPAITFSCAKEEAIPSQEKGNTTLLEVALPSGTKTSLSAPEGKSYHVLWSAGDCISVGGVISSPLKTDKAGKDKAVFEFSEGLTAPFNIIYPGTASADKVTFPASQGYKSGTFDAAAAPMWGVSTGFSDATLHHLTGIVRIRLTGSSTVRLIRLNASHPVRADLLLGRGSGQQRI